MKINQLHIPKPCGESWDKMTGGAKERFCDACQHEVHDLSAMTKREAEALLERGGESLCVRYTLHDGEMVFQQEAQRIVGTPRLMAQVSGLNRLVAAAALVVPLLIAGCDAPAGPAEPSAQAPLIIQEGKPVTIEPGAAKPPVFDPAQTPGPTAPPAEEAHVMGEPAAVEETMGKVAHVEEEAPEEACDGEDKAAAPVKTPNIKQPLMGKPMLPPRDDAEQPRAGEHKPSSRPIKKVMMGETRSNRNKSTKIHIDE